MRVSVRAVSLKRLKWASWAHNSCGHRPPPLSPGLSLGQPLLLDPGPSGHLQ